MKNEVPTFRVGDPVRVKEGRNDGWSGAEGVVLSKNIYSGSLVIRLTKDHFRGYLRNHPAGKEVTFFAESLASLEHRSVNVEADKYKAALDLVGRSDLGSDISYAVHNEARAQELLGEVRWRLGVLEKYALRKASRHYDSPDDAPTEGEARRTSSAGLKALRAFNKWNNSSYANWSDSFGGAGVSDDTLEYWITYAENEEARELRTSEIALKALKLYNEWNKGGREYPDWFSVRDGRGVPDEKVKHFIEMAEQRDEMEKVRQEARDEALRTSARALRALQVYNASFVSSPKNYTSWDATNHGAGSTDEQIRYWIGRSEQLTDTDLKALVKQKRRADEDALMLRLLSVADKTRYRSLDEVELPKDTRKAWRLVAKVVRKAGLK